MRRRAAMRRARGAVRYSRLRSGRRRRRSWRQRSLRSFDSWGLSVFSGQGRECAMSDIIERELAGQAAALSDGAEAIEWAAHHKVRMVDLKFCDLLGSWQHVTLPLRGLSLGAFEEGLGFDGSSIRGW